MRLLTKYAYVRAVRHGQSISKQIQSFSQFGVPKANILADEHGDGRKSYGELLQALKKGDLLVIKTLTALGDGYDDIATEWTRITGSVGADIYVVDMPALDTRIGGDNSVVSAAVVQLLNYCADKARKQSALQAKGIQEAKERGVKFGRPMTKYSDEFVDTVNQFCRKQISLEDALCKTNMKQSSFYYHVKKLKESGLVANAQS